MRFATRIARALALTFGIAAAQAAIAGPAACAVRVNNTFDRLFACVTLDGVRERQAALQAIADANGSTRVSGSPGYDASADYVAQVLVAAGYDVTIQEFQFQTFIELSPTILEQVAPPPAVPVENKVLPTPEAAM